MPNTVTYCRHAEAIEQMMVGIGAEDPAALRSFSKSHGKFEQWPVDYDGEEDASKWYAVADESMTRFRNSGVGIVGWDRLMHPFVERRSL